VWLGYVGKHVDCGFQSAARKGGACQVAAVSAFLLFLLLVLLYAVKYRRLKTFSHPWSYHFSLALFLSLSPSPRNGFAYLEANKSHLTF
jgi:hypothetical protein